MRVNLVRMAFWNNSISQTLDILKTWNLKDLHKLLEPEYMFMDEQKTVIVEAITHVSEELYDNVWLVIGQVKALKDLVNRRDLYIDMLKMVTKMRKEYPPEEFKSIAMQDEKWKSFFKELPKLRREAGLK